MRTGGARWPYAVLAYLFVALALVGIVLPGIPTTPFVLLAAWAASRGSRRLHDWLLVVLAALFLTVGTFVVTRPRPVTR